MLGAIRANAASHGSPSFPLQIYVGNLMPGAINEVMLTQIFNTALAVRFPGSNVPGMEPVIKVRQQRGSTGCMETFWGTSGCKGMANGVGGTDEASDATPWVKHAWHEACDQDVLEQRGKGRSTQASPGRSASRLSL